MSQALDRDLDFSPRERGGYILPLLSRALPGTAALALSAVFGTWILYIRPADLPHAPFASRTLEAPAAAPETLALNPYGDLFDLRPFLGPAPVSLAKNFTFDLNLEQASPAPGAVAAQEPVAPAPAAGQFAENVPLPVPRPAGLEPQDSRGPLPAAGRRLAQQNVRSVPAPAPADNRSFFEKLFGPPAQQQPSGAVLAYAAPQDGAASAVRGLLSTPSAPQSRYDRWTAVYDVSAHTVYLPNGTKLEAHSGLGNRLDNPNYVHERMRGATPPNIYALQPREALFHGVQALRLIPIGGGELYGRTGLLAHTYMLGPNGDSNGCVSFRNYNAFLQAYQNGEIKRLAVVTRLN